MATASEIAKLRRRIGDRLKADQDIATGNGLDSIYSVRFNNVFNVEVRLNGVVLATNLYTVNNAAGTVTFSTAPTDTQTITITYAYAAYTDEELSAFITEFGFGGAVVECLQELLADSARLYDYSQGQSKAQKSQVFAHINKLLERYDAESDTFDSADGSKMGSLTMGKRTNYQYRPESGVSDHDLSRYDPEAVLE